MDARVSCMRCKAALSLEKVPVEVRVRTAELVRGSSVLLAARFLNEQTSMPLSESKAVAMHLSRQKGCCQRCRTEIGVGEVTHCPKCRALTITW